jgi:hypothetical protein
LDVHEVASLLLLSYGTVGIVFINFCQITGMAEHTHPDYDSMQPTENLYRGLVKKEVENVLRSKDSFFYIFVISFAINLHQIKRG